jgi:hypothetical protein
MKRATYLLFLLMLFVVGTDSAIAQGTGYPPPPPCCTIDSVGPRAVDTPMLQGTETAVSADSRVYVSIPDGVLRIMGMTRSQFVDRLAAGLFQDRSIDILVPSTDLIDPGQADPARAAAGVRGEFGTVDTLVAVELRRIYKIPRFRVGPEVFEALDRFVLTDGEIRVTVQFRREASPADKELSVR